MPYTNFDQLQSNNYSNRPFLDPISSLNTRKDFQVDPKKFYKQQIAKNAGGGKGKKKNLTFNQLLAKFGYIKEDGLQNKQRVRPWHV